MVIENSMYKNNNDLRYIFDENSLKNFVADVEINNNLEPEVQERVVRVRESIVPRGMNDEGFTSLNLKQKSSEIIGNLFDRVEFLEKRITDMNEAINLRTEVHENNIKELDEDIKDRENTLMKIVNLDDVRDFKLDLSMLRREKRKEKIQFWKDILEIRCELQQFEEEYRMESKIATLFKN